MEDRDTLAQEELHWHIGKEGTPSTRLNMPPFRAFFFWVKDGLLVNSADFSREELIAEIERRKNAREDVGPFAQALKRLERA